MGIIKNDWYIWHEKVGSSLSSSAFKGMKSLTNAFFELLSIEIKQMKLPEEANKALFRKVVAEDVLKRFFGKRTNKSPTFHLTTINSICYYTFKVTWFQLDNYLKQEEKYQYLFVEKKEIDTEIDTEIVEQVDVEIDAENIAQTPQIIISKEETENFTSFFPVFIAENPKKWEIIQRLAKIDEGKAIKEINKNKNKNLFLLVACVLLFCGVSFGIYAAYKHKPAIIISESDKQKIKFELVKTDNNNGYHPATLTYHYDFSHLPVDTLWANYHMPHTDSKSDYILKSQHKFVFQNSRPIYDYVLFSTDKKGQNIVKKVLVHIKAKNWIGYLDAGEFTERVKPYKEIAKQGKMYINPMESPDIKQNFIPQSLKTGYSTYHYISDFTFDIDNCTIAYETENNQKTYGISAYDSQFHLSGEDEKGIHLVITRKGSNYSFVAINTTKYCNIQPVRENHIKYGGEAPDTDMSLLTFNPDSTLKVKLKIAYPKLEIYLQNNPKPVFQTTYKQKIGKMNRMDFGFKGAGSVYYLYVYDKNGKQIYKEDFDGEK